MKKWIIIVSSVLGLTGMFAMLYWYEAKYVPDREFRRIIADFEPYVVSVDIQSEYELHERLEMSVGEYYTLLKMLEEGWDNVDFLVRDSSYLPDPEMFTAEERMGELKAFSKRSSKTVLFNMIKNRCDELLVAIVREDKVLLEYSAKMQVDQIPFVHVH